MIICFVNEFIWLSDEAFLRRRGQKLEEDGESMLCVPSYLVLRGLVVIVLPFHTLLNSGFFLAIVTAVYYSVCNSFLDELSIALSACHCCAFFKFPCDRVKKTKPVWAL